MSLGSTYTPNPEAVKKAKSWEIGSFFKNPETNSVSFVPADGVIVSKNGELVTVNIAGIERKVKGIFVNTASSQLEFLRGLAGAEKQALTLEKRIAGGLSSIMKANLEV